MVHTLAVVARLAAGSFEFPLYTATVSTSQQRHSIDPLSFGSCHQDALYIDHYSLSVPSISTDLGLNACLGS